MEKIPATPQTHHDPEISGDRRDRPPKLRIRTSPSFENLQRHAESAVSTTDKNSILSFFHKFVNLCRSTTTRTTVTTPRGQNHFDAEIFHEHIGKGTEVTILDGRKCSISDENGLDTHRVLFRVPRMRPDKAIAPLQEDYAVHILRDVGMIDHDFVGRIFGTAMKSRILAIEKYDTNLAEQFPKYRKATDDEIEKWSCQLASVVGDLLKYDIRHNDLHPFNIMLSDKRDIKVIDWGYISLNNDETLGMVDYDFSRKRDEGTSLHLNQAISALKSLCDSNHFIEDNEGDISIQEIMPLESPPLIANNPVDVIGCMHKYLKTDKAKKILDMTSSIMQDEKKLLIMHALHHFPTNRVWHNNRKYFSNNPNIIKYIESLIVKKTDDSLLDHMKETAGKIKSNFTLLKKALHED